MPEVTDSTDQIKIKIPKADENEVVNIPSGVLGNIDNKLRQIDGIVYGIIVVTLLALASLIISVVGLFLEQFRFNNVVYKEYIEKIDSLESLQDTNSKLLREQIENQDIIMKQQQEIQGLLEKSKP